MLGPARLQWSGINSLREPGWTPASASTNEQTLNTRMAAPASKDSSPSASPSRPCSPAPETIVDAWLRLYNFNPRPMAATSLPSRSASHRTRRCQQLQDPQQHEHSDHRALRNPIGGHLLSRRSFAKMTSYDMQSSVPVPFDYR